MHAIVLNYEIVRICALKKLTKPHASSSKYEVRIAETHNSLFEETPGYFTPDSHCPLTNLLLGPDKSVLRQKCNSFLPSILEFNLQS